MKNMSKRHLVNCAKKWVSSMKLDIKNIKAVIFDIDGTILDSMPIWQEVSVRYLRKQNIEPEKNLTDMVFTMTLTEGCNYVKERYNLAQSAEEIKEGIKELIKDFYNNEAMAKPGVVALIKHFNSLGIPMVMATTGDAELATGALRRLGLLDYFSGLFVCGDYNTNKGENKIFDIAKERLENILGTNINYNEILVLEDSLRAIKTTKGMGFRIVGIAENMAKNDWEEIEKLADYFYHSLEEAL